jgi:hypothetical protein
MSDGPVFDGPFLLLVLAAESVNPDHPAHDVARRALRTRT